MITRITRSLVVLAACGGSQPPPQEPHEHGTGEHGMHHRFTDAERWAKVFDDPARDARQKPNEVIAALQLTPTMHVADVGAGTGYFAFRLARAVPQGTVYATDIEPDMVRYLGERAAKEGITNVTPVLGTAGDPALAARSVDRVLVVDVWHHLSDRVAFAQKLVAALRPGGSIAVVDFKLEASAGPPRQHRLAAEVIADELRRGGLEVKTAPIDLPDHYIVIGTLP